MRFWKRRRKSPRVSEGIAARDERATLMEEIRVMARQSAAESGRAELSEGVMTAMEEVPRDAFVPPQERAFAWLNRPLPIGQGQTISQPFVVALMTDLLDVGPDDTVLEIGTGCGYQAAVLARLAGHVISVERIPELADAARERLADLGVGNVEVLTGDGHLGWRARAPYDKIMVTAAAEEVPPALIEQLAPGGRMIIPVGRGGWLWGQMLTLVTKDDKGAVTETPLLGVAFVPLVHGGEGA